MKKGDKTQNEQEQTRASIGTVKDGIKHVDLYKMPSGQKSTASKKSLGRKQQ